MKFIDMHTHSAASDGTSTPTELIKEAKKIGLSAISLTDHDTIDGLLEGKTQSLIEDIIFINGIEFSSTYKNREIHILGYDFDEKNENLISKLKEIRHERNERNLKMIKKLRSVGLNISIEDFEGINLITRAHFGKILVNKGYAKDKNDAFSKYLKDGCPTFVQKEYTHPKTIIDIIIGAGGFPVLAHPLLYGFPLKVTSKYNKNIVNNGENIETEIKTLKKFGLMGLECYYPLHSPQETKVLLDIAKDNHLIITGGSDYHGALKTNIFLGIGKHNLKIPFSLLEDFPKG